MCWLQEASAYRLSNRTCLNLLFCRGVLTPEAECQYHCGWTGKSQIICSVPGCIYKVYNLEWGRLHSRLYTYLPNLAKFWLTVSHSCLLFSCFSSPTFAELHQRVPTQACFLVTVSSCYVCLAHGMLFFTFSTQIPCCSLIYLKYLKSTGAVI